MRRRAFLYEILMSKDEEVRTRFNALNLHDSSLTAVRLEHVGINASTILRWKYSRPPTELYIT